MYDFELFRVGHAVRHRKTGKRYRIVGFDRDPHQFGVDQTMTAELDPIDGGRKAKAQVINLEFA